MATDALAEVSQMNQKALKESNGTQANAFVSEMKASALFQFDWGELLSAAPTALALTGSCWVAAASEAADAIKMGNSVPIGGFKFIPNRPQPTLRSILVDGKEYQCAWRTRHQLNEISLQQWKQRCIQACQQEHGRLEKPLSRCLHE